MVKRIFETTCNQIIEFGHGAASAGGATSIAVVVNAMAVGTASSIGIVSGFTALIAAASAAGVATGAAVTSFSPTHARPSTRKLGLIFTRLAGLGTAAFTAYQLETVALPPDKPLSSAPVALLSQSSRLHQ